MNYKYQKLNYSNIDDINVDIDDKKIVGDSTDSNFENEYIEALKDNNSTKIKKNSKKYILLTIILLIGIFGIEFLSRLGSKELDKNVVVIRGNSRKDKYGIELNKYILNGVYSQGFDNNKDKTIEEWSLYTPPCRRLYPNHLLINIKEPKCEGSSLQFINISNNTGEGYPYSLPLHDISELMKKFKHWKDSNNTNPNYENQDITQLLDENYHPYDYGFVSDNNTNETIFSNDTNIIPIPRKRRLFSFIPFDFEFELLDIYLAEKL
ncbi:hypothetical protein PIROE2DRAFT_65546 [Piromyces sp. E2]|nr:hypothetical protein PIROE2DRAFT_65546 [Piromyces sp. E2]|eukprot:OUM56413.1 hypothetical protein PIROE2DRAFT_65546 [Piromyces sp. E2]